MDDASARLKALAYHLFAKARNMSALREMDTAFYHFILFGDLAPDVAAELGHLPQKGRSTLFKVLSPETFKPVGSSRNPTPFAEMTIVIFEMGFSGEAEDKEDKRRLATGIAKRLQADALIVFNEAWSYNLEKGIENGLPSEYVESARKGVVQSDFYDVLRRYAYPVEKLVLSLFTPTLCIAEKTAVIQRSRSAPARFEREEWLFNEHGVHAGSSLVYPWATAT
jgi:hypothetical protein